MYLDYYVHFYIGPIGEILESAFYIAKFEEYLQETRNDHQFTISELSYKELMLESSIFIEGISTPTFVVVTFYSILLQ